MKAVTLRPAAADEETEWLLRDTHLPRKEFRPLAERGRLLWITAGEEKAGVIRWGLFWDEIPFLNLLWLEPGRRRMGFGAKAMELWENARRAEGYRAVMTSSQADEEGQHFYRRLGYRDAGGLLPGIAGMEQAMEIFFMKGI